MPELTKTPHNKVPLLHRISGVFLGTRDFKKLAKESVELITKELREEGIVGAAIFRVNEKDQVLNAYAYAADAFHIVERLLPAKFAQLSVPFTAKENLLIKAVLSRETQEGSKLAPFALPTLTDMTSTAIQKAVGISRFAAYPLRLRAGKIVGVLFVGFKEDRVTEEQSILLESFRLQLELAFENVLEFERVVERYKRTVAKTFEKTHEEDIPTVRFTLRLTPAQNNYLEKKSKVTDTDKTTLIRDLIEGDRKTQDSRK